MKKYLLLLTILLLIFKFGNSQTNVYFPLPDSNTVWLIQNDNGFGGYHWYNYSTPVHKEDTIINGKTYAKISQVYLNINYCGALRSDTSGKTFIVPKDSLHEYLLQDLSKNTGDSVYNVYYNIPPYGYQINFHVDSTDHIAIGPYLLKRMFLRPPSNYNQLICGSQYVPLIWIEKIGSAGGGFFNNITCGLGGAWLNCMSFNDTVYYKSSNNSPHPDALSFYTYGHCEVPLGLNEINQIYEGILLSPNPFSFSTTFKTNGNFKNAILTVYNSFGQQVKQIKNISGQEIKLQRDNLPSGLYFIRLTQDNEVITADKLIITD